MTDPHAMLIAMAKAMMLQQGRMFPEVLRGLTPEQLSEHGWEDAVPIARAALTALAEPTADMVEAGEAIDGTISAGPVFTAMINTVLGER